MTLSQVIRSSLGHLTVAINTIDVVLVLQAGEGANFPSSGFPVAMMLDSTFQETVTVLGRVTDVITLSARGGTPHTFPIGARLIYDVTITYPVHGGPLGDPGGAGIPPSGPAGGILSGTYPNPDEGSRLLAAIMRRASIGA